MVRTLSFAIALVASCAAFGCNRAPDDLREWRPSDHHNNATAAESDPGTGRAAQVTGSAEPTMPGLEDVTIVAWLRNCTTCHGSLGRGDGPRGPMVKARDLSDPAWQASVSDAQLAESITKGKNAMPGFPLPASTIDGLVHLVRLLDRSRKLENPGAPAAGGDMKQAHGGTGTPAASASSGH